MQAKKSKKERGGRKFKTEHGLSFSKLNFQLFGLAILIMLVGYWALSQPPVDGFLSLTLAPILLVIGYCVLIPVAILVNRKKDSNNN